MNILDIKDTTNLFIIFMLDIGIIFGALGVVFLRKIIYSALLLGLVFICVALWYLILNADFLAAAQVLIYVGAVNVLIVFAIMLVNKPSIETNKNFSVGNILAFSVFLALFIFLTNMILNISWDSISIIKTASEQTIKLNNINSIEVLGIHILTDQLLPFELLSILLLVSLAGAITIARKDISSVFYKDNVEIDVTKR
jgi:NAD(P)H-quinone oxidoreductase subunit 6